MTEVTDGKAQGLANGSSEAEIKSVVKQAKSAASVNNEKTRNDVSESPSKLKNGDSSTKSQKGPNQKSKAKSAAKSRVREIDKSETPLPTAESMGCNNTRAVIEPSSLTRDKKVSATVDSCKSEGTISDKPGTSIESKSIPDRQNTNKADANDSVFCDQPEQGEIMSSDSGVNRSRNTSRTSESTNSDTEKCVAPSESASESTEKVVTRALESSDVTDVEETPDDGNVDSSGVEAVHNRPHSLSLPRPLQHHERRHKGARNFVPDDTSSDDQVSVDSDISSFGSSLHGVITRKGDMIEFVTDNLQEKIRGSRDSSSMGSRTSSMRSISSVNSISSYTSSLATSVSGMSRSPSSLVQQSPDAAPPIDPQAVQDLEAQARVVADSVDLMMGNLKANLFKMSAITVGTLDAYKHSVESTCEAVDASIKSMYALMAKCEELSLTVKPVYQLGDQIKEIKRLLDLFENQLDAKS